MGEILPDLLQSMKDTLNKCDDVFLYQHDLWRIFSDSRLDIWQSHLPEATNVGQRIEGTIRYLQSKENAQGQNALVLFLQVLSERYPAADERYSLLLDVIHKVQGGALLPQQEDMYNDIPTEANPGHESMFAIAELEPIRRCACSVARIKMRRYRQGKVEDRETGTGWLIAPGLVLTCWYIVAALMKPEELPPTTTDIQLQLSDMLLQFEQDEDSKEDIEYGVSELEYPLSKADQQDFALLRLRDRSHHPYSQFNYLPIELDTPFTRQTQLSIVQHPWGKRKQIAIPGYFASYSSTPGRIRYTTETQPGTSGAPVLNRHNWHVVAVHNGKIGATSFREGTHIKYILSELQDKKPDLYREIMQAQHVKSLPSTQLISPLSLSPPIPLVTFQASFSPVSSAKQEQDRTEDAEPVVDHNKAVVPTMSIQQAEDRSESLMPQQATSQNALLKKYRQKIVTYRPKIRHIRKILATKPTLYPDECHQLLEKIQPLNKPVDEMEKFTSRKLSRSYPGRLELTASLHHLQALLAELSERLTTFCSRCQNTTLEDCNEIMQKVDELNKALSLKSYGKHFRLWLHR